MDLRSAEAIDNQEVPGLAKISHAWNMEGTTSMKSNNKKLPAAWSKFACGCKGMAFIVRAAR